MLLAGINHVLYDRFSKIIVISVHSVFHLFNGSMNHKVMHAEVDSSLKISHLASVHRLPFHCCVLSFALHLHYIGIPA